MSCPTLDDVSRAVFSKTARSCPGHREAVWDRFDRAALTIGGWRLAEDFLKNAAERAQAVETKAEEEDGQPSIGRPQQEHCPLDPAALEVAVRRLAERRAKRSDE